MGYSRTRPCALLCLVVVGHVCIARAQPVSSAPQDVTLHKKSESDAGKSKMVITFTSFPAQHDLFGRGIMESFFSPIWSFFNFDKKDTARKEELKSKSTSTRPPGRVKNGEKVDFLGGGRRKVEISGSVKSTEDLSSFQLKQDLKEIEEFLHELQEDEHSEAAGKRDIGGRVLPSKVVHDQRLSTVQQARGIGSLLAAPQDTSADSNRDVRSDPFETKSETREKQDDSLKYQETNGEHVKNAEDARADSINGIGLGQGGYSDMAIVPKWDWEGKDVTSTNDKGKKVVVSAEGGKHDSQSPPQQERRAQTNSPLERSIQKLRQWLKSEREIPSNRKNSSGREDAKSPNSAQAASASLGLDSAELVGENHVRDGNHAEIMSDPPVIHTPVKVVFEKNENNDARQPEEAGELGGPAVDRLSEETKPTEEERSKVLQSPAVSTDRTRFHTQDASSTAAAEEDGLPAEVKPSGAAHDQTPSKQHGGLGPSYAVKGGSGSLDPNSQRSKDLFKDSTPEPGGEKESGQAEDSSTTQPERARRSAAAETLPMPLDDVIDKIQRRSVRAQDSGRVHGARETTTTETTQSPSDSGSAGPAAGSSLQDEKSQFLLGYKRFLKKLALLESSKDTKKGVEAGRDQGDQHGGKSAADKTSVKVTTVGNGPGDRGDGTGLPTEATDEVIPGKAKSAQGQQSNLGYEIRIGDEVDDNDDVAGDYDDSVEILEFRRRRQSNGGAKGRKWKSTKNHSRLAQTWPHDAAKESLDNYLQKRIHRDRRRSRRDISQRLKRAAAAMIKRSRHSRSAGSQENGAPKQGPSNHTLLDDADVVFIVKHKQPSQTDANKIKIKISRGRDAHKNSSVPSASQEMKEHISFLELLKSGKDKPTVGKSSRHVPNVGPHAAVSEDDGKRDESTKQPEPDGPSVQRVTQPPLFAGQRHPLQPFHPHFHRPPKHVDLRWKHTQESTRHSAAILVFVCLALILVIIVVIALTRATSEPNGPRRDDSSTALYVNYPHY